MSKFKYTVYRIDNDINGNPKFRVMLFLPANHKGEYCLYPVVDSNFAKLINGRWSNKYHGYNFSTYENEYDYLNKALKEYTK